MTHNFKEQKGEDECPPPPQSPTTFETVDEI